MIKNHFYEKIGTKTKKEELCELVPKMREKGFYKPKEHRKINWPAYTLNQINDIYDSLIFIKEEVDRVPLPIKNKTAGKPAIESHILAKTILFVELLKIPELKAEEWIRLLGHHLGIHQKLDDRVIGKAYKK